MFRYNKHNRDVAASTSDISAEKKETEQKQQQQTSEMEVLQKIVEDLEENLQNINKKTEDSEKKIEEKNAEIQQFISKITDTKEEQTSKMGSKVSWFSMMVPFAGSVYDYLCKLIKSRSDKIVIEAFNTALSTLTKEQQRLKEQQWDIQNKLMDKQLKLAKLRIENGTDPTVFSCSYSTSVPQVDSVFAHLLLCLVSQVSCPVVLTLMRSRCAFHESSKFWFSSRSSGRKWLPCWTRCRKRPSLERPVSRTSLI